MVSASICCSEEWCGKGDPFCLGLPMGQGGEPLKSKNAARRCLRPSALSVLIVVTHVGTGTPYFVKGIGRALHFVLHLQVPGFVQNNLLSRGRAWSVRASVPGSSGIPPAEMGQPVATGSVSHLVPEHTGCNMQIKIGVFTGKHIGR